MKQTIIKIMKKKQPKWKPIKMGDRLPCQSFLRKKNGEILKLSTGAGVTVGQDAYYLPVNDVIEEIKNYPIEESEDERIRKGIIQTLEFACAHKLVGVDDVLKMKAYLEKQGEHKKFRDSIQVGDKVTRNEDGVLVNLSQLNRVAKKDENQGGQKPIKVPKFKVGDFIQFNGMGHTRYTIKEVCGLSHYINTCNKRMDMSYTDANFELVEQKSAEWSEEDEVMLRFAIEHFEIQKRNSFEGGLRKKSMQEFVDWLKSLKDRVQPQPKQEWNEEDKRIIDRLGEILYDCHSYGECSLKLNEYSNLYDWLKSLRPQSLWKPSIAQLNALSIVSKGNAPDDIEAIVSLYNDLKKLKG